MLNEKQRRFVALYRTREDAAQAAAQAGYSPRRAGRQARELLKKPEVAAALAEKAPADGTAAVSQEKIVRELARIAFGDGEVRDGDKLRALEMLTKLLPGPDGADGARTGVVILPEVMPEEARGV